MPNRVIAKQTHSNVAAILDAVRTNGDVALRDGLLCTLGIMESFTGPYGRLWEVGARPR